MASVKLEHIYKVYTGGTKAVSDLTMEMKDGEFIVLVGPSGCGKSTTLRMIAGLEEITAGELYIGDQIVNDMEPKDRDIAMVFQNYALYPQMTVYENMAFGLKLRHVPNDVIQSKVMWAANILGLTELLDRKPKAMSGGQRQRVALGRAILRDPKVMLLDEPLSNLDAKLRASMRTEIAKLHQRLKTTFIYVTHDQTEAMTLGDRVLVMKGGRMQQFDTPKNLYNYPDNKFVAGFIGTPQMNFFDGYLTKTGENVIISFDKASEKLELPFANLIKVNPAYLDGKHHVTIGVRCEHVQIVPAGTPNSLAVKVNHFEELGAETLIYGNIGAADVDNITDASTGIIIRLPAKPEGVEHDSIIYATFDVDHTYFFDCDTEESIVPRIPVSNAFSVTVRANQIDLLGATLNLPAKVRDYVGAYLTAHSLTEFNGTANIPNDAFTLADQGDLAATVVRTEDVNGTPLLHLNAAGRTFFVLAGVTLEAGAQVQLKIDWSRVGINDDAGDHVVTPIAAFDEYHGVFVNYKTVQGGGSQIRYPEFAKMLEDRVAACQAEWDAKANKLEEDFQRTLDSVTPDEFKALLDQPAEQRKPAWDQLVAERKAQAQEELTLKINEINEQIAKTKAATKQSVAQLKADHKKAVHDIKANNAKLYADLKAKEVADYKQFLATNKDRDTIKRRRDEYHIFRDTFADQKNNALEQALKGEEMVFDNNLSKVKAESKRTVANLKKKIADSKEEAKRSVDPYTYLINAHKGELAKFDKERKAALYQAGLIFFFGIGEYRFPSTPVISGKLIQGLGTRVFTKNYLIEVPHDAYTLSETTGVQAVVNEVADYGERKFAVVSYFDSNGEEKKGYLLIDNIPAPGTHIFINFDITRSRITETGMGIRLY